MEFNGHYSDGLYIATDACNRNFENAKTSKVE
jgi:hypothetical protein